MSYSLWSRWAPVNFSSPPAAERMSCYKSDQEIHLVPALCSSPYTASAPLLSGTNRICHVFSYLSCSKASLRQQRPLWFPHFGLGCETKIYFISSCNGEPMWKGPKGRQNRESRLERKQTKKWFTGRNRGLLWNMCSSWRFWFLVLPRLKSKLSVKPKHRVSGFWSGLHVKAAATAVRVLYLCAWNKTRAKVSRRRSPSNPLSAGMKCTPAGVVCRVIRARGSLPLTPGWKRSSRGCTNTHVPAYLCRRAGIGPPHLRAEREEGASRRDSRLIEV